MYNIHIHVFQNSHKNIKSATLLETSRVFLPHFVKWMYMIWPLPTSLVPASCTFDLVPITLALWLFLRAFVIAVPSV